MKVLVTGGAGFIGSHIVDGLRAAGHGVAVLDDLSSGERGNLPGDVPLHVADIVDTQAVARVFAAERPDVVCHQAAQMSVSRSMRDPLFDAEVNVFGSLNVFEHAVRVGVRRIVFASSGGVLYGEVTSPASESSPKQPKSAYGISKWVGEQYLEFYARERGIQGVALRYSNVYGPRQNPHGEAGVVAIFCKAMLAGSVATINGDGHYIRDYVSGTDVARANLAVLEKTFESHFTALNVGTGIGIDVNQLADQILPTVQDYLQSTGSSIKVPPCRHGEPRIGDLRSNVISPSLAQQLIGWTPQTSLSDGIRETVRWFGENRAG